MTQSEKIELVKDSVKELYSKDGKSISYIANLFKVERNVISKLIKKYGYEQKKIKRITPSNQKFINKNKPKILSMFLEGIPITEQARILDVTVSKLSYIIRLDDELENAKKEYLHILKEKTNIKKVNREKRYLFETIDSEEWKQIVWFSNYQVSNFGRIRRVIDENKFLLLTPSLNQRNGKLYVSLRADNGTTKNLQVARLVGFAFVDGHSEFNNTIDHKDGDVQNNKADNLNWVSQSKNNELAFKRGKKPSICFIKNKRFKKLILDNKYEFKTFVACAKFLNISETQLQRYISGECKTTHKFNFIY